MSAFSETRFRTLVEEAAEGICQADAQGIIQFANRRAVEIFGASGQDDLVGKSSLDLLVESERPTGRAMMQRRARGFRDRYEIAFVRANGSVGSARLSAAPLFEDGVFAGSFSVITAGPAAWLGLDSAEGQKGRRSMARSDRRIVAICTTDADSLLLAVDRADAAFWAGRKLEPGAALRNLVRGEDLHRYDQAFARALTGAPSHSTILDSGDEGRDRAPALWSFSPRAGGQAGVCVVISEIAAFAPSPRFPDASTYDDFGLTDRERDVADLLLMGLEYKGIARRLGISLATVQTHVASVYRKMGVHSAEDLEDLISRM
jgi:PAS domain S-box-containing protein